MIALVVIGLVAIIAIGVVWSRVGLSRSERRSMQNYEHTLHVLGDVARRSDAAARVRPVDPETVDHGHVRRGQAPPANPLPRPRLEPTPQRFGDEAAPERPNLSRVGRHGGAAQPVAAARQPADRPSHPARWGRISLAATAVLVCTGGATAGLALTRSPSHHLASDGSATHRSSRHGTTTTSVKPTGTTTPHALVPVSSSPSVVSFVAPKGTYHVLLTDSGGTCWVGIQQTAGGPWLWQETLSSGQTASYAASGPLVIRIGAPKYLGVEVNGLPARLPGFVQPYDLAFNPAGQPSTA